MLERQGELRGVGPCVTHSYEQHVLLLFLRCNERPMSFNNQCTDLPSNSLIILLK